MDIYIYIYTCAGRPSRRRPTGLASMAIVIIITITIIILTSTILLLL